MNPADFEAEQIACLPPEAELVTFAKDQPQYRPLPVARLPGYRGVLISRWTLTPEERAAIAAGEDLYIQHLTFNNPLQPLLPTVGLPELCPMDT